VQPAIGDKSALDVQVREAFIQGLVQAGQIDCLDGARDAAVRLQREHESVPPLSATTCRKRPARTSPLAALRCACPRE
jgi:hypothetical protein